MLKFVLSICTNEFQDKYEVVLLNKPPMQFLHLSRGNVWDFLDAILGAIFRCNFT
jgi:hypothetical protein